MLRWRRVTFAQKQIESLRDDSDEVSRRLEVASPVAFVRLSPGENAESTSNPPSDILVLPIFFNTITLSPRVAPLYEAVKLSLVSLHEQLAAESSANLLIQLMDNRVVFENVLNFLPKSDRHHFLRVMPLNLRVKLLQEFPALFDNAPPHRDHWTWFSQHWLELLDGKKWVVSYWNESLRRGEAIDIWHAIPAKLRRYLMSSLELDLFVSLLQERMPWLDWDRLFSELEMLESIRDTWYESGLTEEDLDADQNAEDEELRHNTEHALLSSVTILWPHLTPLERYEIWMSMKEAPEMANFVSYISQKVPRSLVFDALAVKHEETGTPFGFLKYLWPLLNEQKDLRKSFLEDVLPSMKPEWVPVFGNSAAVETLPRQLMQDIVQMDKFDEDLLCERLWSYKDGKVRLALISCRLRFMVPEFDEWVLKGDNPAAHFLFFVALGKVRPEVLDHIAQLDFSWTYLADKPLDAVWGALDVDERVKSFASLAFVRSDLLRYTQTILRAVDHSPNIFSDACRRAQSSQFVLPQLWPLLDKSTRRAMYVLWQKDPKLEEVLQEMEAAPFARAYDIEEVEECLWQRSTPEKCREWLEAVYGDESVPALLQSLNDAELENLALIKEPKLDLVAENLWPSMNHVKRDLFLRHSGIYPEKFRSEYSHLPRDLVIHFLSSPSPRGPQVLYHAWKHLNAKQRLDFIAALFSEGPLESLFATNRNTGQIGLPQTVLNRWKKQLASEEMAPSVFENVIVSLWKATEGELEFRYRFLKTVFHLDFFGNSARHDGILYEGSEVAQVVMNSKSALLRHFGPPLCKVLPPAEIAAIIVSRELDDQSFAEALARLFFMDPKTKEHIRPGALASVLTELGYSKGIDVLTTWWKRIPAGDRMRLELLAAAEPTVPPSFFTSLPSSIIERICLLETLPQSLSDFQPWFKEIPVSMKLFWIERRLDFWPIVLGTALKENKVKTSIDGILEDMEAPCPAQLFLSTMKATKFNRSVLEKMLEVFSDDSPASTDKFFNSFLTSLTDKELEIYLKSSPTMERFSQELWAALTPAVRRIALLIEVHQEFPFSHNVMNDYIYRTPANITACLDQLAKSKLLPSPTQIADYLYEAMDHPQRLQLLSFILQHDRHTCDEPTVAFANSFKQAKTLVEALQVADDPRALRWALIYEGLLRNRPPVSLIPE